MTKEFLRKYFACSLPSLIPLVLTAFLISCGGGSSDSTLNSTISSSESPTNAVNTFSVSVSISGLTSGVLELQNNGTDVITVTTSGISTFKNTINANGSYSVTVSAQPEGLTCTVGSGTGNGVIANVTNVTVVCSAKSYSIGGTVSGLIAGQQVTLYNNGGDANTVIGGGTGTDTFSFATPVAYLGSYVATVNQQPNNQTCSVSGGTGAAYGVGANINSVALVCTANTYSVGGTISGLVSGQQVTLYNNGGDANTVIGGGTGTDTFTFATPVAYLGSYVATINQQPINQVCTVSTNPSGANNVAANISNIGIVCALDSYTISGNVIGLMLADSLTLTNNGANAINITGNSFSYNSNQPFVFSTPVAFGSSYDVEISSTNTIYSTCRVDVNNTNYPNPTTSNISVGIGCSINGYCHNGGISRVCTSLRTCPARVTCTCPSGFSGPQCDTFNIDLLGA